MAATRKMLDPILKQHIEKYSTCPWIRFSRMVSVVVLRCLRKNSSYAGKIIFIDMLILGQITKKHVFTEADTLSAGTPPGV